MDKVRQILPNKNLLWLDREKFQNSSDDDDNDNDDSDDEDDDNDVDDNGDNGCEVGRDESLVKKRKKNASTLEGDSSRNK